MKYAEERHGLPGKNRNPMFHPWVVQVIELQYVMAQKQHKIPFKVKKRVCLLDLRFSEGFLAFFLLAASC